MTIRSAGQLDWFLDQRLGWRKKELTGLKFAVDTTHMPHARVIRRAALALLYAHWEGFVKEAGTAYLEMVSRQRRPQGDLLPNFVAIARRDSIQRLAASNSVSHHAELIRSVREGDADLLKVPWRGVLRTRSNLKYDVLLEILATLGFDSGPYALMAKPVIDALVKRRNGIAHGEGLPVSIADYHHFHSGTITLLDTFRDQLSDAAGARDYLAA